MAKKAGGGGGWECRVRDREREDREEFGEGDEIGRRSILICRQKGGREGKGEGVASLQMCVCVNCI